MPYVTCPNCRETFHLRVTENIEVWNKKFPLSNDEIRYIECFHCWKELRKHDVVEVFRNSKPELQGVEIGDIGTVVSKYSAEELEVECVNLDGTTKWLHTMQRKNIKYLQGNSCQ